MSEAIQFDTHKFVKRMTEAGMPEQTAEALADEQLRFIQGELANKQDVALVQHDIALLKQDVVAVQQDIALLKQDVVAVQQDIALLKQDVVAVQQDIALLRKDIALLKQDVVAVQQDITLLKQDVAVLDATVRQGLAESKSELLKWLVGMQLTTISAMVAALAFLVS